MMQAPPTIAALITAARRESRRAVRHAQTILRTCAARVWDRRVVTPIVIAVGVTAVVIGMGGWLVRWYSHRPVPRPSEPTMVPAAVAGPTVPRWLDGMPIPADALQPRAIAVVVDNAPEARPQVGLADAPFVFELPVEGQRTRFLALYPAPTPSGDGAGAAASACPACAPVYTGDVGPIRSARPACVGIADVLGAPLVHIGGSRAALALLRTREHVDEWSGGPIRRITSRPMPFNAYATVDALMGFLTRGGLAERRSPDEGFLASFAPARGAGEGTEASPAAPASLRIAYGGERAFNVAWQYDPATGVSTRLQGGQVHRDADGTSITAQNVIVLHVTSRVLDRVGRLAIPELDAPLAVPASWRRAATVFIGGERTAATWAWSDPRGPTGLLGLLRDRAGDPEPITLRPGTTWVEIANESVRVE